MPLVGDRREVGVRNRPASTFVVVAATAALFLVAGVVATVASDEQAARPEQVQRREAVDYLTAVEPLARDAGRVIQLGMKPGVEELRQERRSAGALARAAASWERETLDVRDRWRDVDPPPELVAAHETFLRALEGYAATAATLGAAAQAPRSERSQLLDEAVAGGERSDDVWDEAAAQVQGHLRALGEPTVTWLPGGTPAQSP